MKKKNLTDVTKKKPRKNSKSREIIELATQFPDMTPTQIGNKVGCSHSNVIQCLQRYGINQEALETYKGNRAEVFAGLQERILSSLTPDDLKKTPAIQRITAAGILYDKERLERGQANQITSIQTVSIDIQTTIAELKTLKSGLAEFSGTKQNDPEIDVSEVIDVTPENVK